MSPLRIERAVAEKLASRSAGRVVHSYERAARAAFSSKPLPSIAEREVLSALARSHVLVVGDDRLVPADQARFVDVVDSLTGYLKSSVLLTDRFAPSRQGAVNRFLRGAISVSSLMEKLGAESRGEDRPEGGVRTVFLWARDAGISIRLVPGGGSSASRDRALTRAAAALVRSANRVLIWTGALRLAPPHLPAEFRRAGVSGAFLCLRSAEARWRSGRSLGWLRYGSQAFVDAGASPFLAIEMARAFDTRSGPLLDPGGLGGVFVETALEVRRLFGFPMRIQRPVLRHPFDVRVFDDLRLRRFGAAATAFLRRRAERGESCVVPASKLVYLATLDLGDLAEEAAHYVRTTAYKRTRFGVVGAAVEEAWAFAFSRILVPSRALPRATQGDGGVWHKVHADGYALGARLAKRWRQSAKARAVMADLWAIAPRNEVEAAALWHAMAGIS